MFKKKIKVFVLSSNVCNANILGPMKDQTKPQLFLKLLALKIIPLEKCHHNDGIDRIAGFDLHIFHGGHNVLPLLSRKALIPLQMKQFLKKILKARTRHIYIFYQEGKYSSWMNEG